MPQMASIHPSCSPGTMSQMGLHPRRGLTGHWLRRFQPCLPLHTVRWRRLLLLASLLPLAWSASPLPREEEIVFPEKLNGSSIIPGSGVPGRLLYRLPAFGEMLLLELEQDPGVQVEGLTVQYLGQAPEMLGVAEPGTYLTGTINGDPESVASLHWDGGALLGVLQYRGAELHLQPLEGGALNSAGGPGAHILRRKSPASSQGPMCTVKAPSGSPSPISRRTKVGNPGDRAPYSPSAVSALLTLFTLSPPTSTCSFPASLLLSAFPISTTLSLKNPGYSLLRSFALL